MSRRAPTKRRCGACTACCVAPGAGLTRSAPGRAICCSRRSPSRTEGCEGFRCLWLDGLGEAADRPDLLGLMLSAAEDEEMGLFVLATETKPGATDQPRARALLEFLSERAPVVLVGSAGPPGVIALTVIGQQPAPTPRRTPRGTRGSLAARAARRRGKRR